MKSEKIVKLLFDSELVTKELCKIGGSDATKKFAIVKETSVDFYGSVHGELFSSPATFRKIDLFEIADVRNLVNGKYAYR